MGGPGSGRHSSSSGGRSGGGTSSSSTGGSKSGSTTTSKPSSSTGATATNKSGGVPTSKSSSSAGIGRSSSSTEGSKNGSLAASKPSSSTGATATNKSGGGPTPKLSKSTGTEGSSTTPSGKESHAGQHYFETKSGAPDRRSAAMRSGDLKTTQSGTIDARSSAVRRGDALVTQNQTLDHRSAIAKPSYQPPTHKPSWSYDAQGNLKDTSGAVKRGDVKRTSRGDIKPESKALQHNEARLTKEGEWDHRYGTWKHGTHAIDPAEMRTHHFRDSYAQQKYSKEHPSSKETDASRDVAHYASLQVAIESLKHRRGPHMTEAQYKDLVEPIVNHPLNFRMVSTATNREQHVRFENEIKNAMQKGTKVSSAAAERAALDARRLVKIADDFRQKGDNIRAHEAERMSEEYMSVVKESHKDD
ncbi:hypothetical protein P9112_013077 [Eukaryota sp. TZLM1-RC]